MNHEWNGFKAVSTQADHLSCTVIAWLVSYYATAKNFIICDVYVVEKRVETSTPWKEFNACFVLDVIHSRYDHTFLTKRLKQK